MHVETSPQTRVRGFVLSPALFRRLALGTAALLYVIVASGATVRLTGSGLGCEHWPGCEAGSYFPEKDYHAFIEFGNRLVGGVTIIATLLTWLAARRARGLPRFAVPLALGVFLGTLAQAPLGALTVATGLHPLLVMPHLLLSIVVLGAAVVVALEALALRGGTGRPFSRELRRFGVLLAAGCFALVVSGALVTAAGPHSGGEDVRRFGSFTPALYAHAASVAAFGCGLVFVLGYLVAQRDRSRSLLRAALGLAALMLVQMAIGELQYRNELPWWLVLVHVAVAAAVWVWTVVLVTQLFRPLPRFTNPPA